MFNKAIADEAIRRAQLAYFGKVIDLNYSIALSHWVFLGRPVFMTFSSQKEANLFFAKEHYDGI